ncbi:hypothetical protein CPC08DRAFT_392605 [Agrocybe pediades]|nr:hypothetical protein CPC08DRAFT_392605 [Agrocybe pediades]
MLQGYQQQQQQPICMEYDIYIQHLPVSQSRSSRSPDRIRAIGCLLTTRTIRALWAKSSISNHQYQQYDLIPSTLPVVDLSSRTGTPSSAALVLEIPSRI